MNSICQVEIIGRRNPPFSACDLPIAKSFVPYLQRKLTRKWCWCPARLRRDQDPFQLYRVGVSRFTSSFFICLPFWLPRLNASEMENRDWRRAIFLSFWFLIRSLFSGTGLFFFFLRNPFSSAPLRIELNLSLLLLPAELIWNQLGSHAWVETQSSFPDLLDQKSTSIKMGQWTVTRHAGPVYISDIWLGGSAGFI